ncbi:MAG: EcsC family protein [Acidobacteriota bacterium]
MQVTKEHLEELRYAKQLLEKPSLAARLTDRIGAPIEKGFKMLPDRWSESIQEAVNRSLSRALQMAVSSLRNTSGPRQERWHSLAAITVGATGGAFGLPGLLVELPISTTIIFRSIADIARSEGEDLESAETKTACLEVFALGGPARTDDGVETGYFAVRSALAQSVSEAARHIAERGLSEKGAPALVKLISAVTSRFGVTVSEKVAAMAVPAIGAAGGAVINSVFIHHFQDMARGHFVVRRLEKCYDTTLIQREYEAITL